MPSPLAHIGLSLALAAAFRRPYTLRDRALLSFAAIAPDFDVLPMLWDPQGLRFHHGPTHSLLGAAVIGLVLSIFSHHRLPVVAATLLHVPLDWSTGDPGVAARYGVPLFWPFSPEKYIASHTWFGAFGIDTPSGLGAMFSPEAVAIYGKEVLTVLLAWTPAIFLRRR